MVGRWQPMSLGCRMMRNVLLNHTSDVVSCSKKYSVCDTILQKLLGIVIAVYLSYLDDEKHF